MRSLTAWVAGMKTTSSALRPRPGRKRSERKRNERLGGNWRKSAPENWEMPIKWSRSTCSASNCWIFRDLQLSMTLGQASRTRPGRRYGQVNQANQLTSTRRMFLRDWQRVSSLTTSKANRGIENKACQRNRTKSWSRQMSKTIKLITCQTMSISISIMTCRRFQIQRCPIFRSSSGFPTKTWSTIRSQP